MLCELSCLLDRFAPTFFQILSPARQVRSFAFTLPAVTRLVFYTTNTASHNLRVLGLYRLCAKSTAVQSY
jgi:hypothetical protein